MSKNIEINIVNDFNDYEVLYPKTTIENVDNGVSVQLLNSTKKNNIIVEGSYKGTGTGWTASGELLHTIDFTIVPDFWCIYQGSTSKKYINFIAESVQANSYLIEQYEGSLTLPNESVYVLNYKSGWQDTIVLFTTVGSGVSIKCCYIPIMFKLNGTVLTMFSNSANILGTAEDTVTNRARLILNRNSATYRWLAIKF